MLTFHIYQTHCIFLWLGLAANKKLDSPPKEMKASEEGQQSDKEVLSKILEELKVVTIEHSIPISSSIIINPYINPNWFFLLRSLSVSTSFLNFFTLLTFHRYQTHCIFLWLGLVASKKFDSPPKEMKASEDGQQIDKEVLSKILEELKVVTIEHLITISSSFIINPYINPNWFSTQASKTKRGKTLFSSSKTCYFSNS